MVTKLIRPLPDIADGGFNNDDETCLGCPWDRGNSRRRRGCDSGEILGVGARHVCWGNGVNGGSGGECGQGESGEDWESPEGEHV